MKTRLLIISFIVFVISTSLVFAQEQDFTVGQIHLPDRCYSSMQIGTVRVIDPDMNADPKKKESVIVNLWSSRDVDVRTPNAIETGTNTGVFEASVFFNMYDDSFSQRIRAFDGDILYAKYVDATMPYAPFEQDIEITTTLGTLPPDKIWGNDWGNKSQLYNSTYVYDTCMSKFMDEIGRDDPRLNWIDIIYPPPLKQKESGLYVDEIQCKESLTLVIKHDGSPACVKEQSIIPLMVRDWARISEFEITSSFLKHEIENGKIISLKLVDEDCAPFLVVTIDSQDVGQLTISIPRKILDHKIGDFDDDFFVLIDGREADFKEVDTNQFERTLDIPFVKDSKSIEIIKVCLI